jgi:uncharacterized membrane protein YgcG
VPAGELKPAERYQVEDAVRAAEQLTRFEFSVFVGRADGEPRAFATQLHNRLVAPARSVMIMVDPDHRVLEIVTGGLVRRAVSDREVDLVAMQMQGYFAAGDLVGGLRHGIAMLAEHAVAPRTLHAD